MMSDSLPRDYICSATERARFGTVQEGSASPNETYLIQCRREVGLIVTAGINKAHRPDGP